MKEYLINSYWSWVLNHNRKIMNKILRDYGEGHLYLMVYNNRYKKAFHKFSEAKAILRERGIVQT